MRKIANVKISESNAIRLMICDKGIEGIFVFGYDKEDDGSCSWDCHYTDLDDAYEMGEDYGIQKEDWQEINATLPNCQDDWIKPVRVIGREIGEPQWGKYEELINGNWTKIK